MYNILAVDVSIGHYCYTEGLLLLNILVTNANLGRKPELSSAILQYCRSYSLFAGWKGRGGEGGRDKELELPGELARSDLVLKPNPLTVNLVEVSVLLQNGGPWNACTMKRCISLQCIPKQSMLEKGVVP